MEPGEEKKPKVTRKSKKVREEELRAEAKALRAELTDVKAQFTEILDELRGLRRLLKKSEELMLGTSRDADNKLTVKFPRLN